MTTDIPTEAYVDNGPVLDAVLELATAPALASHVRIEPENAHVHRIYHLPDDVPYDVWGSGAQAMWRLILSVAYVRHEVSLYEVVSRLDRRNSEAVANAMRALCLSPGGA